MVTKAIILCTDAKYKRVACSVCNTVVRSPQVKTKFTPLYVKIVHICRKTQYFFSPSWYDHLVSNLLQLGGVHVRLNGEDFSWTLHKDHTTILWLFCHAQKTEYFFTPSLYDNLVSNLFQWVTFHVHYPKRRTEKTFCWHYAWKHHCRPLCHALIQRVRNLVDVLVSFIKPFCLVSFNTARNRVTEGRKTS